MKAVVQERFGPPESLQLLDVEVPDIRDDQVLVQVQAAALNPADWHLLRGDPRIARLSPEVGLRRPRSKIAGSDGAGRVAAVGAAVSGLTPGERVFGSFQGSLAEFAVADPAKLAPTPPSLTDEHAAGLPMAGVTALQCLRDAAKLQPGWSVLINGASGGIGTLAVQLAKAMGAEVTGVCSTRNVGLVHSLGAARVIDYTQEDFTRSAARYDLIFDNAGGHSLGEIRRVLTPTGTYLGNYGGAPGAVVGVVGDLAAAVILDKFVKQRLLRFLAHVTREDLLELARRVEQGTLAPVLDRTYALTDAAEAMRQVEAGHVRGKVIVTVQS